MEEIDSTSDDRIKNNVVRHEYRVLSEYEKLQMKAIKDMGRDFIQLMETLEPSRERSLAVTKVEEAVMWMVKGITK